MLIFPFVLNEMVDLTEYPLIATLTTDKLTENLKIVNDDSLDKEADTLNEEYIKELSLKVVEREKGRAQAAEEVLTRVNLGTVEEPKETQIGSFFEWDRKGRPDTAAQGVCGCVCVVIQRHAGARSFHR